MNVDSNLKDNAAIVHQLLEELDTSLVTLETQMRLEMPSQLELERVEVALLEGAIEQVDVAHIAPSSMT